MNAILLAAVVGQCVGGYCPSPVSSWSVQRQIVPIAQIIRVGQTPDTEPSEPTNAWHSVNHEGMTFKVWGNVVLRGGKRIVQWDPELASNMASYAKAKAESDKPKPAVPTPPATKTGQILTGVDASKRDGKGYSVNGQHVSARFAKTLADAKSEQVVYLTVIGTDDECRQLELDWATNPEFAQLKGAVNFQSYRPDHWAVGKLFVTDGHPTVIVQDSEERETARGSTYEGPKITAEALRIARAGYDPTKTPRLGAPLRSDSTTWILAGLVVLGAVMLLLPGKS